MNLPKTAADAHKTLADAFNTKDVATVMSMYDTEGIFVPEPGRAVTGKDSFQAAIEDILSIPGIMEIKTVYCLETGDLAVGRSEWMVKEGEDIKVSAKGIEVMRRQPDGGWKIVIDHAFGALEELKA